jgi:hypothetical protein
MFIRSKTVKGKKYAYLVKNTWKRGKVKQETKKYLGRIFDIEEKNILPTTVFDSTLSLRDCMLSLIVREFESKGFIFDTKHTLKKDSICIKFTKKPSITCDGKNVVLFLNNRYVYPKLFEHLLDFFEPESQEERKGEKLAFRFRDAGINISQEYFIELYKKIYVHEQK